MGYGTFGVLTSEYPLGLAISVSNRPKYVYMYLEYTNSQLNVPQFDDEGSIQSSFGSPKVYYESLPSTQNYLRIPAMQIPTIAQNTYVNNNTTTYESVISHIACTDPTSTKVLSNNTTFQEGSLVYGSALVLALDPNDRTQDLVIARNYFTETPIEKIASGEVSVTCPFAFNCSTSAII